MADREGRRPRSGTYALSLLAVPLNAAILSALAKGAQPVVALRRAAGEPPQSTLRLRLRELTELGLLQSGKQAEFPGVLEYGLAPPGHELLFVMEVLAAWLAASPSGPEATGEKRASRMIKTLAEAWSSRLIRVLAAKPLTLTELDRLISGLSYPALERRLGAMHRAGLIAPMLSQGPGTPYAVTTWLRQAVAPLSVAARWERKHTPESAAPITRLEVEASFLLAVPLVEFPRELSGACRMVVEAGGANRRRLAGVVVAVEEGKIVSLVTNLDGQASAWAAGSATDWLQAVIDHDRTGLELGGDGRLAGELVDGLHGTLFTNRRREV